MSASSLLRESTDSLILTLHHYSLIPCWLQCLSQIAATAQLQKKEQYRYMYLQNSVMIWSQLLGDQALLLARQYQDAVEVCQVVKREINLPAREGYGPG